MKISFIASRYKESENVDDIIKCVNHFFYNHECKIIIYDKFNIKPNTYKFVPNVGREAYAWFDYVLTTWDNPDDYYVFIHPCNQSERPDKFFKFVNLCENTLKMINSNEEFCCTSNIHMLNVSSLYCRKYKHIGNTLANVEDVKKQKFNTTSYENIGAWWNARTGGLKLLPRAPVHGICSASKNNIQSWGKEFWVSIFNDILDSGENGEIPHFLERAMISIAAGKKTIQNL